MEHRLVNGELKTESGGIVARCSCGWASSGHFSSAGASVAFQNHKDSEARDYAADRERAKIIDEFDPQNGGDKFAQGMDIVTMSDEPGRERRKLVFDCPRREGNRCEVLLKPWPIQNCPTWTWDGNRLAPTLSPSINCNGKGGCGWHGFIRAGKLTES